MDAAIKELNGKELVRPRATVNEARPPRKREFAAVDRDSAIDRAAGG